MNAYNDGDVATALRLLTEEARAGDSQAQVNLGYLYARGQGVAADQRRAFQLYSLAASHGDGEGMNALGYKYEHGTGIPADLAMAMHWYCLAVHAGNARAMNNLGLLMSGGVGVRRDVDQARDLWRQAAELDHSNAMLNLGSSYLDAGRREEGMAWMRRAAERGQPDAQALLRSQGFSGPLPPLANPAARMIPYAGGPPGHARICGDATS